MGQIIEFYLILDACTTVSSGLFYRLMTSSLVMLVAGYLGDTGVGECWLMFIIGMAGWFYIVYEVFSGEAAAISVEAGKASPSAQVAFNAMRKILTYGWAMYPIGYIVGHTGPAADS